MSAAKQPYSPAILGTASTPSAVDRLLDNLAARKLEGFTVFVVDIDDQRRAQTIAMLMRLGHAPQGFATTDDALEAFVFERDVAAMLIAGTLPARDYLRLIRELGWLSAAATRRPSLVLLADSGAHGGQAPEIEGFDAVLEPPVTAGALDAMDGGSAHVTHRLHKALRIDARGWVRHVERAIELANVRMLQQTLLMIERSAGTLGFARLALFCRSYRTITLAALPQRAAALVGGLRAEIEAIKRALAAEPTTLASGASS